MNAYVILKKIIKKQRPPQGVVHLFWNTVTGALTIKESSGEETVIGGNTGPSPLPTTDPGVANQVWVNNGFVSVSKGADNVSLPVLSGSMGVPRSATEACFFVNTNTGNGTLYYYVVDEFGTPPVAGDLIDGTGATEFGNVPVYQPGIVMINLTALSTATNWQVFTMHQDSDGNQSLIDSFQYIVTP